MKQLELYYKINSSVAIHNHLPDFYISLHTLSALSALFVPGLRVEVLVADDDDDMTVAPRSIDNRRSTSLLNSNTPRGGGWAEAEAALVPLAVSPSFDLVVASFGHGKIRLELSIIL